MEVNYHHWVPGFHTSGQLETRLSLYSPMPNYRTLDFQSVCTCLYFYQKWRHVPLASKLPSIRTHLLIVTLLMGQEFKHGGGCANLVKEINRLFRRTHPKDHGPWSSRLFTSEIHGCFNMRKFMAGEMAQRLRALFALPEVISSTPINRMVAHNHMEWGLVPSPGLQA